MNASAAALVLVNVQLELSQKEMASTLSMLIPVSTAVLVQLHAQQALLARANGILEYIDASSIQGEASIFLTDMLFRSGVHPYVFMPLHT